MAVLPCTQATGETNIPQNPRVGTKRYMAPEMLDMTMNMAVFESFRRVDVYGFGLMMWETVRRCMTHEGVEDYALPFFDMVRRRFLWQNTFKAGYSAGCPGPRVRGHAQGGLCGGGAARGAPALGGGPGHGRTGQPHAGVLARGQQRPPPRSPVHNNLYLDIVLIMFFEH